MIESLRDLALLRQPGGFEGLLACRVLSAHRDPAVADREDDGEGRTRFDVAQQRVEGPDDRTRITFSSPASINSQGFDPEVVEECRASPARSRAG